VREIKHITVDSASPSRVHTSCWYYLMPNRLFCSNTVLFVWLLLSTIQSFQTSNKFLHTGNAASTLWSDFNDVICWSHTLIKPYSVHILWNARPIIRHKLVLTSYVYNN